ncbi:hypothetical protein AAG570_006004 [Ranatra chinensis]|uniref:Uncharacterized protein n=1 Tax=Ranatra chinensis TaxID=642074 RepID=A0ABD0YF75_9HEMI
MKNAFLNQAERLVHPVGEGTLYHALTTPLSQQPYRRTFRRSSDPTLALPQLLCDDVEVCCNLQSLHVGALGSFIFSEAARVSTVERGHTHLHAATRPGFRHRLSFGTRFDTVCTSLTQEARIETLPEVPNPMYTTMGVKRTKGCQTPASPAIPN